MTRMGIQAARTSSPVLCERCGRAQDAPCRSRLTGRDLPRWHVVRVIAAARMIRAESKP